MIAEAPDDVFNSETFAGRAPLLINTLMGSELAYFKSPGEELNNDEKNSPGEHRNLLPSNLPSSVHPSKSTHATVSRQEMGKANYIHSLGKRVASIQQGKRTDSLSALTGAKGPVKSQPILAKRPKKISKASDGKGNVGVLSPTSGTVRMTYAEPDDDVCDERLDDFGDNSDTEL